MLQSRRCVCICDGTGRRLQEMIIAGIPIPRAAQFDPGLSTPPLRPISSRRCLCRSARATPFRGGRRLLGRRELREGASSGTPRAVQRASEFPRKCRPFVFHSETFPRRDYRFCFSRRFNPVLVFKRESREDG